MLASAAFAWQSKVIKSNNEHPERAGDCDRVLRIESPIENTLPVVISEVEALGLVCADLEY
jgi:hypothetical protein